MKQLRLFLFLCIFVLSSSARAAEPATIALKAARLFDGKSKALITNAVVIVQGDKIVDAGSNLTIPQGAQVIDLGDATLSPGFMDAHTHLTADFSRNYNQRRLEEVDLNVSEQAIIATTYARATIEAGFTTVRDLGSRFVGSKEFVDVALRNAINHGIVPGPRMLVATYGIGATGPDFAGLARDEIDHRRWEHRCYHGCGFAGGNRIENPFYRFQARARGVHLRTRPFR
jgi:imidazolonepropionase-like amidohydrolase